MRQRGTEIICDNCGETEFVLVLEEARYSGWKIGRTRDLCWECVAVEENAPKTTASGYAL